MTEIITKSDLDNFLDEVKNRVETITLSKNEEKQMAMDLIRYNASKRGLSVKSYLEQEGVDNYKILNLSDDEMLVNDNGEVYKIHINKTKGVPVKVGFRSITKEREY